MKSFDEVKCPFCGNDKDLDWDTDPNYFDPDDKGYEVKDVVTCPKCCRDFSVFSRYEKTRRDFIKVTDEIQYLGDKAFKLVDIDINEDPDQQ